MLRKNFPNRKLQRQRDAIERQRKYDALTYEQKYAKAGAKQLAKGIKA
jgi:hypothetical protein